METRITQNDSATRLDIFLARAFPRSSRAYIQTCITRGGALVNGALVSSSYRLKAGDRVWAHIAPAHKRVIMPNPDVALTIIDEQKEYLIIEKKSGTLVHPASNSTEPTLADGLAARYTEVLHVGEHHLRPGIVHRLDRDVSGVMVIARTNAMFKHLKRQFKNRTITKEYIALVHGAITQSHGSITTPIGRAKKGGKMAAHPRMLPHDRDAHTDFVVSERFGAQYTLVRVRLRTGRSHQIRVHFNSIGHPIVGDHLYAAKKKRPEQLQRMFLHAHLIGFKDLNDTPHIYTSVLPSSLRSFLKKIRASYKTF